MVRVRAFSRSLWLLPLLLAAAPAAARECPESPQRPAPGARSAHQAVRDIADSLEAEARGKPRPSPDRGKRPTRAKPSARPAAKWDSPPVPVLLHGRDGRVTRLRRLDPFVLETLLPQGPLHVVDGGASLAALSQTYGARFDKLPKPAYREMEKKFKAAFFGSIRQAEKTAASELGASAPALNRRLMGDFASAYVTYDPGRPRTPPRNLFVLSRLCQNARTGKIRSHSTLRSETSCAGQEGVTVVAVYDFAFDGVSIRYALRKVAIENRLPDGQLRRRSLSNYPPLR